MADILERIEEEAESAEERTQREHKAALKGLRVSAEEARGEVKEEARKGKVRVFSPFEEPLGAIREEIALEKRRGYLPGSYRPGLAPLREAREELKVGREEELGKVELWKGEELVSIKEQLEEGEKEIEASLAESLVGIEKWEVEETGKAEEALKEFEEEEKEWEAEYHKLDTGEWLSKEDYSELDKNARDYINKYGIDWYNKYYAPAQAWVAEAAKPEVAIPPSEEVLTGMWVYEVETPTGKVEVPAKEWEAMSVFQQIEMQLGQEPTRREYLAYKGFEGEELGEIPSFWSPETYKQLFTKKFWEEWLGAYRPEETPISIASKEYMEYYGVEAPEVAKAAKVAPLIEAFFGVYTPPVAPRLVYPQIEWAEIPTKEKWLRPALFAAEVGMVTAPMWVPPVVRGVKGAAVPLSRLQFPLVSTQKVAVVSLKTGQKFFDIPKFGVQKPWVPGAGMRLPVTGLKAQWPVKGLGVQAPISGIRAPITGLGVRAPWEAIQKPVSIAFQKPIGAIRSPFGELGVRPPVSDLGIRTPFYDFAKPISQVGVRAPFEAIRAPIKGIKVTPEFVRLRVPVYKTLEGQMRQLAGGHLIKPIPPKVEIIRGPWEPYVRGLAVEPLLGQKLPVTAIGLQFPGVDLGFALRPPLYGWTTPLTMQLQAPLVGLRSPITAEFAYPFKMRVPVTGELQLPITGRLISPFVDVKSPIMVTARAPFVGFRSPITAEFRSPFIGLKSPFMGELQLPLVAEFRTPIGGLRGPITGLEWRGWQRVLMADSEIPGITSFAARLRTWPFSEPAGFRRIPVLKTAVRELPLSRAEYEAIFQGVPRRPLPGLEKWPVKRLPTYEPSGRPRYTYPEETRVGFPKTLTQEEWLRYWKPAKVVPELPRVPSPKAVEWLKPKVQYTFPETVPTVWEKLPSGRYMPAGAKPITIPDLPVLVPAWGLLEPTEEVLARVIPRTLEEMPSEMWRPAEMWKAPLRPTVAISKPVSIAYIPGLTPIMGIRPTVTEVKVEPIITTKVVPITKVKTLTQVRPALKIQEETLTKLRTITQAKPTPITGLVTKVATKVVPITKTRVTPISKLVTPVIPVTVPVPITELITPITTPIPSPRPRVTPLFGRGFPRIGRGKPKPRFKIPLPPSNGKKKKKVLEGELPAGTITWRQGFIRKTITPPYAGRKPKSTYEPRGSGVPKRTLRIVGGPAPITARVDLGVTDIKISGKTGKISFTGRGLKTDVGKRILGPTKGMSVKRLRA